METLQRTANRGSISTGYDIDNSLKLENDNSESLTRSAQDGGNRKITTISFWTKRTELTSSYEMLLMAGVNSANYTSLGFGTGNEINFHYYNGGSYPYNFTTQRLFRDTSAWYHIVIGIDTTQATDTNRVKFYVNGEQIANSDLGTNVYPSQDIDTPFNNNSATYPMEIGNDSVFSIGGIAYSGYIAEFNFIDGSQLTPTSFGEFDEDSGIWKPKAYTGSYGTNGFYLDFETAGSLGADSSGNSNNFSLVNITSADQATDTPTNNFCTLNPLIYDINSGDDESYSCFNGATTIASSKNAYAQNYATIGLNIASGGKWYFEWTATSTANGSSSEGLCGLAFDTQWNAGLNSTGVYNADFAFYAAGFGHGEGYGANVVNGLLIDLDNNKVKWYRDGTLHVTMPDDGGGSAMQTSGYAFPYIAPYGSGYTINANFGGYTAQTVSSGNSDPDGYGNFEYPTQGGYAICTKNLAEYG